jgi:hypothetical protein
MRYQEYSDYLNAHSELSPTATSIPDSTSKSEIPPKREPIPIMLTARFNMNADFMEMLRESPLYQDGVVVKKWTIAKLAEEICASRPRVTEVLNNKHGHGGHLRPKLARLIRRKFSKWREMLAALHWDESGSLLTRKTPNPQTEFQFVKPKYRRYAAALDARVAEKIPLTHKAQRFSVNKYSRWAA